MKLGMLHVLDHWVPLQEAAQQLEGDAGQKSEKRAIYRKVNKLVAQIGGTQQQVRECSPLGRMLAWGLHSMVTRTVSTAGGHQIGGHHLPAQQRVWQPKSFCPAAASPGLHRPVGGGKHQHEL